MVTYFATRKYPTSICCKIKAHCKMMYWYIGDEAKNCTRTGNGESEKDRHGEEESKAKEEKSNALRNHISDG